METVIKNISELVPSEKNARIHSPVQIKEMVKSVNQFGVIRPIIIDENNVILCGHGLWQALKEAGKETAECKVVSGLTEKQKTKLMLADNKIYSLGVDNYDMLDKILSDFGAEADFEIPGYNSETLEDLYGIKSVEKSAQVAKYTEISPKAPDTPAFTSEAKQEQEKIITPSEHTQAAREEAIQQHKKVMICPHCGEVIEL